MTSFSKGFRIQRKDKSVYDPAHASARWVYGSLAFSWLLDLSPLASSSFFPNFVVLSLAFWAIYQPWRIYYWLAFVMGLLTDADTGAVFGQHALAFCCVVFLTEMMNVRLRWLGPVSQTVLLFAVFFLLPVLKTIESFGFGYNSVDWNWFVEPFINSAIWPLWWIALSRWFLADKE